MSRAMATSAMGYWLPPWPEWGGALPDFLVETTIAAGYLVPLLINHPSPEIGMFVVRPPVTFPFRKIRVLIDILIEHLGGSAKRPPIHKDKRRFTLPIYASGLTRPPRF